MVRLALALLTGVLVGAPTPPAGVSVSVSSSGQDTAVYRVEVRNDAPDAADLVVRQSVPRGVAVTGTNPEATVSDSEITWRVPLGGRQTRAMSATFQPDPAVVRDPPGVLAGGACAYGDTEGAAPADCAAATWQGSGPAAASPPWWRHWLLPLAFAFLALGVLAVILRRRAGPMPSTAQPRRRPPRRTPPMWTVLALAVMLLVGGGAAVATAAVPRLAAITGTSGTPEDGWIGPVTVGEVGEELRENVFAFTAYRVACSRGRCAADVGVRNPSGAADRWYPAMQRMRAGDDFVTVDEAATAAANGRDVFAEPLAPGEQRIARLWFTLPARARADVLELRSGAFANGVRVDF